MTAPEVVFEHLKNLDQTTVGKSADYRQEAQAILADPRISLRWRQAIADRLNQANHLLALVTVGDDDSY